MNSCVCNNKREDAQWLGRGLRVNQGVNWRGLFGTIRPRNAKSRRGGRAALPRCHGVDRGGTAPVDAAPADFTALLSTTTVVATYLAEDEARHNGTRVDETISVMLTRVATQTERSQSHE
jgi:hypothetical protein